jgi:hypothetical protein
VLTDVGGGVPGVTEEAFLSGVLNESEVVRKTLSPYRSPSRGAGSPPSAGDDLWAVGLLLFESLTGKLPEGVETPSDLVRDLPGEVDAVFRRSYARPDRRFSSAGEMAAALFPEAPVPTAEIEEIRVVSAKATCPVCRGANRVDHRFCVHCGASMDRVTEEKKAVACRACGKPRFEQYTFCPYCGARYGKK